MPPSPDKHALRILVADDEDMFLNIYKEVFSHINDFDDLLEENRFLFEFENPFDFSGAIAFDVTYCSKKEDVVECVEISLKEQNPYAIAFLDIRMPLPEDGILAGEKIRQLDPNIELVFVTGFTDYDPIEIASRIPPVHKMLYIQKPFSIHELLHFAHSLGCKWLYEESNRKQKEILEALVEKKTAALQNANKNLEKKVKERTEHLEETNTALKVLLSQRENDKSGVEEVVIGNTQQLVMPMLEKLKSTKLNGKQINIVKTLEANLESITYPFIEKAGLKFYNLTPMELQTANLVKTGLSNKEIADVLGVSAGTIMAHRHNLREKLGLKNTKLNLRAHLMSISTPSVQ
jgi:DNA-binding NarL/FixJ family response regulator